MTIKPRNEFSQLLLDCGLSPRSYADLSGTGIFTVRNWIAGTATPPSPIILHLRKFRQAVLDHFPEELRGPPDAESADQDEDPID